MDVVRAAFEFSAQHDVPVCGFLGEECVTHRMHPELEELHHRQAGAQGLGKWAPRWAAVPPAGDALDAWPPQAEE